MNAATRLRPITPLETRLCAPLGVSAGRERLASVPPHVLTSRTTSSSDRPSYVVNRGRDALCCGGGESSLRSSAIAGSWRASAQVCNLPRTA